MLINPSNVSMIRICSQASGIPPKGLPNLLKRDFNTGVLRIF